MKALKALALLAVCGLTFSLTGCDSYPAAPEDVAKAFSDKMNNQDYDGAKEYATKAGGEALDKAKQLAESMGALGGDQEKEAPETKSCTCEEDGDKATCKCEMSDGSNKPLTLVKEDGKWKVDFKKGPQMEKSDEE